MVKVKELTLVFENCETCTLSPDEFKYLIISGIKEGRRVNCFQYMDGEADKTKSCDYFCVSITEKGLKHKFQWNEEFDLLERLNKCSDITAVELNYVDDESKANFSESFYVKWDNESDFWNRYQHIYTEDKMVKLVICKGNPFDEN